MHHDTISAPFELGTTRLRNRLVLAPMTRVSAAADGTVTERIADYYRVFAGGGFGLLITEGVFIDQTYSPGYVNQPGLVTEEHICSWRHVTEAVHAEGAAIVAQLMHAGPQSQGDVFGYGALGPTETPARGEQLAMYGKTGPYPRPERMSADDIGDVVESFVRSAQAARSAGFDGVEIHAANGYLLDAFLTEYLNDRDDEWGGSPERRAKLTTDVCRAVRAAVGEGFIVGVRISQAKVSDPFHKWSGPEEAERIFTSLADASLDYVHTTEHQADAPAFDSDPRTLAQFAEAFAGTVVIANGHIDTPGQAASAIERCGADLVAVGKSALSNRDWVFRALRGESFAPPFRVGEFGPLATVQDWETHPATRSSGTASSSA